MPATPCLDALRESHDAKAAELRLPPRTEPIGVAEAMRAANRHGLPASKPSKLAANLAALRARRAELKAKRDALAAAAPTAGRLEAGRAAAAGGRSLADSIDELNRGLADIDERLTAGGAVLEASHRCRECGRHLADPVSVEVGYGADCCARLGIDRSVAERALDSQRAQAVAAERRARELAGAHQ